MSALLRVAAARGQRRLATAAAPTTLLTLLGRRATISYNRQHACACVLLRGGHSVAAAGAGGRQQRQHRHRHWHQRDHGPWGGGSVMAAAAGLLLALAAGAGTGGGGTGPGPCECKALRHIHDFYKIVEKPIGAGGFGVVCVGAHRETGETVAIKQVPKKVVREWKVQQEIEILRLGGDHRNIIGFRDVFQDEDNWYIVMEMAEGGELFDRLVEQGAYSEAQASAIMRQIVDAVTYLHQQGVVHCDLKPENLLLATKASEASDMRLVDFGSAFRADNGKLVPRKGTGTIAYSAPEVISGKPCGFKADIWALGVLMYILLSGYHPFDPMNDADDDQIGERIVKEGEKYVAFDHPVWDRISPDAKALVKRLLTPDTDERPTAQELLHHPWIAGGTELSNEPLEESAENLRRFHRGRRRLKALMLAVMAGLANEPPAQAQAQAHGQQQQQAAAAALRGGPAGPEELLQPQPQGGAVGPGQIVVEPSSTATWSTSLSNSLRLRASTGSDAAGGGGEGGGPGKLRARNSHSVSADALGSRRAAVRMLDPDNKGFVTEADLARVLRFLGEELSERELREMVVAGHGDPHAKAQTRVAHEQLVTLLPPLCPSKVFQRRELMYAEGEVDHTYYLLQKGEALLRFECPTDGRSSSQVALETLKGGDTFGEMEMMIEADGSVLPRATSCECLSPRCEVIAIDDHLFSLLTDVFDATHSALRAQAEARCKRLVDRWAENQTAGKPHKYRRYEPLWGADRRDPHKLYLVKDGFLEVEVQVEAPAAASGMARQQHRVVKRYGPGTYVYTRELHGRSQTRPDLSPVKEVCKRVKTLTDTRLVEVPARAFEDFLKVIRREEVVRFLLEAQEAKGNVLVMSDSRHNSTSTGKQQQQQSAEAAAAGASGGGNGLAPTWSSSAWARRGRRQTTTSSAGAAATVQQ